MRNIKRLSIVCSLLLASASTASADKVRTVASSETIRFECVQGFVFAISYSGDIAQVFEKGMYPYYSSVPMKCREVEDK